ncbi:hypothetical protein QTP88_014787 [Uroleucon formosanum]
MDDSTSIMAYAPYFKLEVSIIRQCARIISRCPADNRSAIVCGLFTSNCDVTYPYKKKILRLMSHKLRRHSLMPSRGRPNVQGIVIAMYSNSSLVLLIAVLS